jgi:hypothetical protein
MSTIVRIAVKELITLYRSRVAAVNAAILLLLLGIAAYGGYKNYRIISQIREQAQREKRPRKKTAMAESKPQTSSYSRSLWHLCL